MSNHELDSFDQRNQNSADQRAERRAVSLLRLLNSDPQAPIDDPELREEFARLYALLQRVDELAERQFAPGSKEALGAEPDVFGASDPVEEPEAEPEPATETEPEPESVLEPEFDPDLIAFDPAELSYLTHTPETDPPSGAPVSQVVDEERQGPETGEFEPQPIDPAGAQPEEDEDPAESLERWWVNFNGEVSLERLARLRGTLNDSPFTIEARFDEITDGLIVLRIVTEKHLTLEQVEWIVRQVMHGVGLDHHAAIVSRN